MAPSEIDRSAAREIGWREKQGSAVASHRKKPEVVLIANPRVQDRLRFQIRHGQRMELLRVNGKTARSSVMATIDTCDALEARVNRQAQPWEGELILRL